MGTAPRRPVASGAGQSCGYRAILRSRCWVIGNSTALARIDPRTNRNVASLTFPLRSGSSGLSEGTIGTAIDRAGTNQPDTIGRVNL